MEVPLLELAYYPRFHEASNAALKLAREVLGRRSFFVAHVDASQQVMLLNVLAGRTSLPPAGELLAANHPITHEILRSHAAAVRNCGEPTATRGYVAVPVTLRDGRVFGVLGAVDGQEFAPGAEQISVLQSLALLLASAIDADSLGWRDRLTGLYTRRMFDDHLLLEIERARRSTKLVAVVIAGFDPPSDPGAPAVAWWLTRMAERLQHSVRKGDTLARVGAAEFGLVMPDLRDTEAAVRVARTLLELLADPLEYGTRAVSLAPSIGVALSPVDGGDALALVARASAAMTATKSAGGEAYQFYSARRHLRLVAAERAATLAGSNVRRLAALPGAQSRIGERTGSEHSHSPDDSAATPVDQ